MTNTLFHIPVRYEDLLGKVSRDIFYRTHRKIVGNIYLHHEVAANPVLITDALLLRCPDGTLRGFAALYNMGFTLTHDDWVPMISITRSGGHIHASAGKILRLKEKDTILIKGHKTVTPVQAVADILGRPDSWGQWNDGSKGEEQVALIDHLLRQNIDLLDLLKHDPRTREIAALANPLAESRPESIVRFRLHQAGLYTWKPQVRVRGRDRFYFVDLGDPLLQVGVEYQGAHHFGREERAQDAQRANDLSWAGWTIMEATSRILTDGAAWQKFLSRLKEEIANAQQRRNHRVPSLRGEYPEVA